jgi:hypothetical protein
MNKKIDELISSIVERGFKGVRFGTGGDPEEPEPEKERRFDVVDAIIALESGALGTAETIELFSQLIKTGVIHSLQGSYQRMAQQMIDDGVLSSDGEVDYDRLDELM